RAKNPVAGEDEGAVSTRTRETLHSHHTQQTSLFWASGIPPGLPRAARGRNAVAHSWEPPSGWAVGEEPSHTTQPTHLLGSSPTPPCTADPPPRVPGGRGVDPVAILPCCNRLWAVPCYPISPATRTARARSRSA